MTDQAVYLLKKARDTFRRYEKLHRDKINEFHSAEEKVNINSKADANMYLAKEIDEYLRSINKW